MSIFSPSPAELPGPAGGGAELIRRALAARLHKGAMARLTHEHGVGVATLEDFARGGQVKLPSAVMSALAKEFFNAGGYDPERDLIFRAPQPEPPPFATVRPEPFKRLPLSAVVPPRPPPKTPANLPPAKLRRPGWAD